MRGAWPARWQITSAQKVSHAQQKNKWLSLTIRLIPWCTGYNVPRLDARRTSPHMWAITYTQRLCGITMRTEAQKSHGYHPMTNGFTDDCEGRGPDVHGLAMDQLNAHLRIVRLLDEMYAIVEAGEWANYADARSRFVAAFEAHLRQEEVHLHSDDAQEPPLPTTTITELLTQHRALRRTISRVLFAHQDRPQGLDEIKTLREELDTHEEFEREVLFTG